MLGWMVWQQGKMQTDICEVRGVPFYRITAPSPCHFWQRRALSRCVGDMRRRGVRRVLVQGRGPDELLWRQGLERIDPAPLRLALLPRLLEHAQQEWKIPLHAAAVRLRGKTADTVVYRAAQVLVQYTRYLELAVETGQTEMEEWLRRGYGLGVGRGKVVLEVCVGTQSSGSLPALYLGRNCAARQVLELFCEEMPWADEQLLSALFQAEKLKADEIQIKSVGFRA